MINVGLNQDLYKNYGAIETNGLKDGQSYHEMERENVYFDEITSKDKVVMERLRLITDSYVPFYDISYIHITFNGKPAELLDFPYSQLNKRGWKKQLVELCKDRGIFIKDLVSPMTISILR
jgi:hypothetical protein